jgi:hypothetical protein
MSIEFAGEYFAPSTVTYDQLGDLFPNYDDWFQIPYDSPFWSQGAQLPAVFGTDHVAKMLVGTATTSWYTTGDMGQDNSMSFVRRMRPRYQKSPASAQLENFYRDNLGLAVSADFTVSESSGKFDFMRNARWHRFKHTMTGDCEIYGYDVDGIRAGRAGLE